MGNAPANALNGPSRRKSVGEQRGDFVDERTGIRFGMNPAGKVVDFSGDLTAMFYAGALLSGQTAR